MNLRRKNYIKTKRKSDIVMRDLFGWCFYPTYFSETLGRFAQVTDLMDDACVGFRRLKFYVWLELKVHHFSFGAAIIFTALLFFIIIACMITERQFSMCSLTTVQLLTLIVLQHKKLVYACFC